MTGSGSQILVVDDDADLRGLLSEYLEREGLLVATAGNAKAMRDWLDTQTADLIILDLMLPGEDGLSLVRWLRSQGDTPIIMVSGRGDEVDRIVGLEVGADDYLPKPFNPRELLARIRAVLRRGAVPKVAADAEERISFGPFLLDLPARRLRRCGVPVALTGGEFDLLRIFAERPNRVLNRDHLLDLLRGYDRAPFDRSIDVQVARLRSKIEDNSKNPRYIRTVWGKGYLFTPRGETG